MKRSMLVGLLLALTLLMVPMAALAQPAEAGTSSGASNCVYHYVQRGQTLSWIARYYGVNMWTIAQRNGIANPNRIYAGQTLLIYCKAPAPKPPPQPPHHPQPPACPPQQWPPGHPACPPPTPPQPACAILPVLGFGQLWYSNAQVRNSLGCPAAAEFGLNAYEQYFKGGYAVGDMNTKMVYAMYSNGTWTTFATNFDPNAPSPYLVPPLGGQYLPRPVAASMQQFQGGYMLWTASRGIYVLYHNGTYRLYN